MSALLDPAGTYTDLFKTATEIPALKDFIKNYPNLVQLLPLLLGQAGNSSTHAAGTVITPKRDPETGEERNLYDWMPVKKDKEGLIVSEWEGEYVDKVGFLKCDILGLSQLDKFSRINELIKMNGGPDIRYDDINLDEAGVYDLFKSGYNEDVFQMTGSGLRGYCKELQPETIHDLIATVAIYRPGPIEIGVHKNYVAIKNGEKQPEYDFNSEGITATTYGLWVYQEQIMQACQVVAGFSLVEADGVRKAMGKMLPELLQSYGEQFVNGAVKNGCLQVEAQKIWDKFKVFGAYAFNKCISGDMTLYRASHNLTGKSTFRPTIREMYKIKNDKNYAKETNHESLHDRYSESFGHCFSLNKEGRLVKNKIIDIYYSGIRPIYRITTESGKYIDTTTNHKFPTSNGEKKLEEIDITQDRLYVNLGYSQDTWKFSHKDFSSEKENLPSLGQKGFQKKEHSSFNTWYENWQIKLKDNTICEECLKESSSKTKKLEVHHIDNNHGNNDITNLQVLCPSCHKKEHYKIGRTKMGEKGLLTNLETIKSIEYLKDDEVYDVEMEAPYHTLTVDTGVVTSNSHSACYGITAYFSQWFKYKYPLEFWTTSLEFSEADQVADKISEIDKLKTVRVAPVDINKSRVVFYPDKNNNTIYWSLSSIKWVGGTGVEAIMTEREKNGAFFSLEEFYSRVEKRVVNKRSVVNLILAGAFDEIENIKEVTDRWRLIESFMKLREEKMTEDLLDIQKYKDYEYIIKQKELTGFGYINFEKVISTSSLGTLQKRYLSGPDLELESSVDSNALVVGVLRGVIERKSKRGIFAQLELDHNSATIFCTIWNETYEEYKKEILLSTNKIVVLTGKVVADNFKKKNVIHSNENTKIIII